MFNKFREKTLPATNSDSDHTELNKAFCNSTNASLSTFESTCFKSTEAVYPTDSDGSDLRKMIESDTFLRNASASDSLQINRSRERSTIIAAGSAKGATLNASIDTLHSTIIDGAMDSDNSFYSPNEFSTNISLTTQHVLNKRLSSDDFKDCESSPEPTPLVTDSTLSTQYKSLGNVFFPNTTSENNNNIFKPCDKSSNSQVSENSDSGVALEGASNYNDRFVFPRNVQHLTTILEESSCVNTTKSKQMSGAEWLSMITNLRKGSLSHLPENKDFDNTMKHIAEILDKTSKEMTIEDISFLLLEILRRHYNYSDGMTSSESFDSFKDLSKLSGISIENSGKDLDLIIKELRSIYPKDKKIENESSPEWPLSAKSIPPNSLKKNILVSTANQKSIFCKKKEYFPQLPLGIASQGNKENCHFRYQKRIENVSPAKKRVSFSPDVHITKTIQISDNTEKKKYAKTPVIRRIKESLEKKSFTTSSNENSFVYWERKCMKVFELENTRTKLRRSTSAPDILKETTIFEFFKNNHGQNNQVQRFSRLDLREKSKSKKRRSKSAENYNYFPEIKTVKSQIREINFPSTSGIVKTISSNQQKTRIQTPEKSISTDNDSIRNSLTPKKVQYKIPSKYSSFVSTRKKKYAKTPMVKKNKESSERKSSIANTSEDSFLYWERKCNREYKNTLSHLRRSNSVSDITEESTTSEVPRNDYCKDQEILGQKIPRLSRNNVKENSTSRKRRSKSLENCNPSPQKTNNGIRNTDANMPSTSGIVKKISSNIQKSRIPPPKIFVSSCNSSNRPTPKKVSYVTPTKTSFLQRRSRKSTGIDNSHIPSVSQLRTIFSPAKAAVMKPVNIPRIEITKSSPERSINNIRSPIISIRLKKTPSSQEKLSQRKPWKP